MAIAETDVSYKVPLGRTGPRHRKARERIAVPRTRFLSKSEVEELRALWVGMSVAASSSVHGGLEATLMRSEPRPGAKRHVLDELERAGGRAPEGLVLHAVAHEWDMLRQRGTGITVYEVQRAVKALVGLGKVQRIPVPAPPSHKPSRDGTRDSLSDAQLRHTGYDLAIVRPKKDRQRGDLTMQLALPSATLPRTREERWAAQDEAIRREWQTMHVAESRGGRRDYEPTPSAGTSAGRALRALERISTESAIALRLVYGRENEPHPVFGEIGAIVAMTPTVEAERRRRALAATRGVAGSKVVRLAAFDEAMAGRQCSPTRILADHARDLKFIGDVRTEAEEILVSACAEYRRARRGGQS